MKAVLISIKPEWVEKIASGQKTIEVRKSAPKETPFKSYIYCTEQKINGEILLTNEKKVEGRNRGFRDKGDIPLSGKVIGEFICRGIMQPFNSLRLMAKESCLTEKELIDYSKGKPLFGWRISDLKIYDKPKELSEFERPCSYKGLCFSCDRSKFASNGDIVCNKAIARPPQSYMFVEEINE